MKLTKRINTTTSVEIQAESIKDTFYELAAVSEAFGEAECGACKNPDVRFVVRTVNSKGKTYKYPELRCNSCFAKLAYGEEDNKDGVLYPKRMETDDQGKSTGKPLPNRGWVKYEKPAEEK
jgi:hypothetical protein